jgi:hypothetical protein
VNSSNDTWYIATDHDGTEVAAFHELHDCEAYIRLYNLRSYAYQKGLRPQPPSRRDFYVGSVVQGLIAAGATETDVYANAVKIADGVLTIVDGPTQEAK